MGFVVFGLVIFFFLSSLIVGGVYEAVCQKTIDSREPAYTERVCRPNEAVEPWKPPPFAFAQVKPMGGCLVKSAGICREVKHIQATVHVALRAVVPVTSTKRGMSHLGPAGLSHRSHRHTTECTRCSKNTRSTCAPPGGQGLWQRQRWQNSPEWLCDEVTGNLKKGHPCSTRKRPKSRGRALGAQSDLQGSSQWWWQPRDGEGTRGAPPFPCSSGE